MKFIKLLMLICLISVSQLNYAHHLPPVNLNIQNILQDTPVWCWAAVSQQIILRSKGPSNTPPQCALVAVANNTNPQYCCSNYQNCSVTGSLQQIQWLISRFGGHYSSIQPPANPMIVYNTLRSGRPIIMAVQNSGLAGHVVVLTGMHWVMSSNGTHHAVLHINDPMSHFTQPVPFQNIAQYWQAAIVVN